MPSHYPVSSNSPAVGGRSTSNRTREARRRQRSLGQENNVNNNSSVFAARQRPPSPSTMKGNAPSSHNNNTGNNNLSPPSSPPFDDRDKHKHNNTHSPPTLRNAAKHRPPLVQQPQLLQQQQQQQAAPGVGSGIGALHSSFSWDEPPDLTLSNSGSGGNTSSNNNNNNNLRSSDRSVSSEAWPTVAPVSPTSNRHGPRQYSPQQQLQQDWSNLSVVSDSCLLSSDAMGGRNVRKLPKQRNMNKININKSGETADDAGAADMDHNDDIPMDERSADIRSAGGGGASVGGGGGRAPPSPIRPTSVNVSRQYGGTNISNALTITNHSTTIDRVGGGGGGMNTTAAPEDDVSSLGGVEESNVGAMTAALRVKTPTLQGLSHEESGLWEMIQNLLKERDDSVIDLQDKFVQQQDEHARAMRAIQRVLADVTQERDQALARPARNGVVDDCVDEKKQATFADERQDRVVEIPVARDEEVRSIRTELAMKREEMEELKQQCSELKESKKASETELETQRKQVAKLKRHLQFHARKDPADDPEKLKKQLEEKSSALENAKMIITSLENASGSLASDTRAKLKTKDMTISNLKMDLHQYKKKLDTLAMELREVQRVSAEADDSKMQIQCQEREELATMLQSSLAELRSASVILETTHDPSSVQNLTEIFTDCNAALERSLGVIVSEEGEDGNKILVNQRQFKQENQPTEVESKIRHEELRKIKEEALHYRLEVERVEKQREYEVKTLHAEMQSLRAECSTNMEVLAKKERELAVLRDSLKVEDQEVGYISDDAEDDEEDDHEGTTHPPPQSSSTPAYGPTQAEALATLLAQAPPSPTSAPSSKNKTSSEDKLTGELAQMQLEKERALKELKTEKESLANAKMIISSLEKANKSMMEDLRSRLHDSNTAIASLLEKSMESEKTTAKLHAELEMEKAKNEDKRVITRNSNVMMTTETID